MSKNQVKSNEYAFIIITLALLSIIFYQNFTWSILHKKHEIQNDLILSQIKELSNRKISYDDNKKDGNQNQIPKTPNPPFPNQEDRRLGDPNSKYVLMVYVDFACLFCQQFHPVAKAFFEQNKGNISLVLRHYPLEQAHPAAMHKAEIVECAFGLSSNKGFWQAADTMFSTTDLEKNSNRQIADILDLDSAEFEKCVSNHESLKIIMDQQKIGSDSNISGTPAAFLYNSQSGKMEFLRNISTLEQLQRKFQDFKKGE